MKFRFLLSIVFLLQVLESSAQLQWTELTIECPCTLQSEDGETATVEFGLQNHLDSIVEGVNATVAIVGTLTNEEGEEIESAFVDTIQIESTIDPHGQVPVTSYEIDLGQMPSGNLYFELIIHTGEATDIDERSIRDSIWFKDEITSPPSSFSLTNMDYLLDSDEDGFPDLNEELEQTDPNDATSFPGVPTIDILLVYQPNALEPLNTETSIHATHILAVTEYLYERSGSLMNLRPVGIVDESEVEELADLETDLLEAVPDAARATLEEKYAPDTILVFRDGVSAFLCGIAEDIGGWRGRGFVHPNERAIYTEVYIDPLNCPVTVTAHEIGHLMGLGHSYEQDAVGAFHWSRGHGVEGEFATIMTYAYFAYQAIEVHVMSNPELDCHGKPCGVSPHDEEAAHAADSAQTLNIIKYQFTRANHPSSEFDYDGDGYAADVDLFPLDASEWDDSDGDGHGDNQDVFDDDPTEWTDTDGDGIGDNSDPDIDDDGVLNAVDTEPFNSESSYVKLLEIESDRVNDGFGRSVLRITDLISDEVEDLAVAATENENPDGVKSGTVYLFSFNDFVADPNPMDLTIRTRSLEDLRADSDTWQIHGSTEEEALGTDLMLLDHGEGGSAELVIVGTEAVHILSLDSAALTALDTEDGEVDQQINLSHCVPTLDCYRIGLQEGFELKALTEIEDFDEDDLTDLGFLGVNESGDEMSIYILTRKGISTAVEAAEDNLTDITQIWEADSSSFEITSKSSLGRVQLVNLGDVINGERHELAIGIESSGDEDSVSNDENEEFGRTYLLSTDQFDDIATLDTDDDRRLDIDLFVGLGASRKLTSSSDLSFGRNLEVVSDVDGDSKNDLFVWGRSASNYLFAINAAVSIDVADLTIDGQITIEEDVQETSNVWRIDGLISRRSPQQKILMSAEAEIADRLVARRSNDVFVAPFENFDYLDDPTMQDLDGVIDLPRRLRYPGIYQIKVPFGPSNEHYFSGIALLGDLDADQVLDFAVTIHSDETEGTVSRIHVIYSSSLPVLDQADQVEDHILALHNNYEDTDSDGIINFHDQDDDGDGLHDSRDVYPLEADYQYDADFDGVANVLDVFPLDGQEQFDLDFDGIGDNSDEDIDGDGILNTDDEFPYDTDNDGIDNGEDLDDDNDGTPDVDDAFPLDPTETTDTDGDGVGDVADVFVDDPTEWLDTDGDGVGNNADTDDDNDGYDDVDDAFPLDPTEWLDSDGDGYGDNSDQFPNNPLEWEDLDGDGFGDNYGISGFASYRVITDWFEVEIDDQTVLRSTEANAIGDIDGDGYTEIVIANGRYDLSGHPIFLLSSADLDELDALDGQRNQVIDLMRIPEGSNSWQLENRTDTADTSKVLYGTVGDLDKDGTTDFVISGPLDFGLSGAAYLVYGNDFAGKDAADGTTDRIIKYDQCIRNNECVRIATDQNFHALALSSTIVESFVGPNEISVVLSTFNGETRSESDEGIPTAYILSHSAIKSTLDASEDSQLLLAEILAQDNSVEIYPEFDPITVNPFIPEGASAVVRIPDFDGDGMHDLALIYLFAERTYLLGSSDLTSADEADGESDETIDLGDYTEQPSSFRIEGYAYQIGNPNSLAPLLTNSTTEQSIYLPLVKAPEGEPPTSYLIETSSLSSYDSADGEVDGVINSIESSDQFDTWSFPDIELLTVCGPNFALAVESEVVNPLFGEVEVQIYAINLGALDELDSADGQADHSISLSQSIGSGVEDHWKINLGHLGENVIGFTPDCAGDLDMDGSMDYIFSITKHDGWIEDLTTDIILLMHADLETIDDLDGSKDYSVDVSRLWPE